MRITAEEVCKSSLKENTKIVVDVYPELVNDQPGARVLVHVMHGPGFINDQGRLVKFFLNGNLYTNRQTDKNGMCEEIIPNIPSAENGKTELVIATEETTWTVGCKVNVNLWQNVAPNGDIILYGQQVPPPKEKEPMPTWEKAIIASVLIVAAGAAGYFLLKGQR